ncbi:MAG: peptidase [Proteobacteria bacterium]|nr:peptidase [Pseudomonadota bacterium]
MNRKLIIRSSIAAAVLAALAGGYAVGAQGLSPSLLATKPAAVATEATPAAPATGSVAMAVATDFSGIVERFGPAVVNISVTGKAKRVEQADLGDENDPFYEFFRHFGPQLKRPQGSQIVRGQGSGFIVRNDGLILTNAHVIDGAQEVSVKLTDRREFSAKVLGVDKKTDIAIIKIDAKNLPVVVIGDASKIRVGEPVLAIGAPYGFENTATAGIVSAKSRTLQDDTYVPFIQTDVAVNPGNSGGPLFNMRGEVIGINSQIYSQTGGYQGLSFAIPMNVVSKVQDQLVKHGKVTRGRIGVTVQDVNQALADSFGLKTPHGALVSGVDKGGPAEKAGVEPGDVIVKLGDKVIERSGDLPALVAELAPGSKTALEVIRKGSDKTLTLTIGEMKAEKVTANEHTAVPPGKLGLAVRPLNADEQDETGIRGGLLVQQVSGPAAKAGIQPGDVVLALNGTPVRSVDELRKLLDNAGKHAALLIQRDSSRIFVPVDLG